MRAARRLRPAALAGIGLLVTIGSPWPGWTAPSRAIEQTPTEVTWSIGPAGAEGADGRARVDLDLDPGQSIAEHLYVRNLSTVDVVFDLSAQDGYLTPQGRFNMLPSDAESVGSGTWIQLPDQVTVAAGSTTVVPYTVDVPADATPGDHIAGIAASVLSTGAVGEGPNLSVESRVGFRVMTRVSGEMKPRLDVVKTEVAFDTAWNPFAPGSIDLEYTVANSGNVRLEATGQASASGSANTVPTPAEATEVFPGDERAFTARIDQVWPLGFSIVTLELRPKVTDAVAAAPPAIVETSRTEVVVWTMPWSQLLLLVAAGLLLLAVLLRRRQRRMAVQRMLDEARREGARSAVRTPTAGAPAAPSA